MPSSSAASMAGACSNFASTDAASANAAVTATPGAASIAVRSTADARACSVAPPALSAASDAAPPLRICRLPTFAALHGASARSTTLHTPVRFLWVLHLTTAGV